MFEWSVMAFDQAVSIGHIVIAVPPGHEDAFDDVEVERATPVTVVTGGQTRSASVACALAEVTSEVVAVHDAARPLVTAELIDAVLGELAAADAVGGVIAAAPVTDTIKSANPQPATDTIETSRRATGTDPIVVSETLDRSALWAVQTPQAFPAAVLRRALNSPLRDEATDDATLVEALGERVLIHPSSPSNFKVTTAADLACAEYLLR